MEIDAPSHWRCVDFISDLHLHESAPQTQAACAAYLQHTPADALFILGDLFEVWVGDDTLQVADPFISGCVSMLHAASRRMQIFIMVGNRDFLMGPQLMTACGASALPDPSVLNFGAQRWLLTHGDALCLDDIPYQSFRAQVRSSAWQAGFLSMPLAQRQAMARDIRTQSELTKQNASRYIDLDTSATLALLAKHHASQMIHGHTHQPGKHTLAQGCTRTVLSDWDLAAQPPRAEVLRLSQDHTTGRPLSRINLAPLAYPKTAD
jgi:UDP-2,3-diacylglucosamine hydrolase